jgi:hypothetical protein
VTPLLPVGLYRCLTCCGVALVHIPPKNWNLPRNLIDSFQYVQMKQFQKAQLSWRSICARTLLTSNAIATCAQCAAGCETAGTHRLCAACAAMLAA